MKKEKFTSEKFTGLTLDKRAKKAAGTPAISSSINQALKWMNAKDALKTMLKVNQKGGFDCPGCAWPDPDDERSQLGEYCENGMKAIAEEATNKRLTPEFFEKYSIEELSQWSDYDIGKSGRLTEPMILREGSTHYQKTSWEDALIAVSKHLKALENPNEAVFYTSGRTSNEAAFLYQLFVREFGTNNMPDCSNMCHESSGKGLTQTVGIGKGSVTLDDFYKADLVLVIGQNPGTNHPRMLTALEKCKANGGKIIAINPLPEAGLLNFINPQKAMKVLTGGTTLADLFLQVRINGDVALLKAIMVLLLKKENKVGGIFDKYFIENKTIGFEEFIKDLKTADYPSLVKASGVSDELIQEAAQMIAERKNMIICWAMGLTQHKNAVGNIQEIVNLLLLRGSIGKPGAGTCPVRGHSNVQGDRTMGVWEAPKKEFLDSLQKTFNFNPPREHGYDTVGAIQAMHEGKAKVFFALGGNFLMASPDTSYTAEALRQCDLTVHVSTKLNRSHLVHGKTAIILPCLGRTEIDRQESGDQFVTCENSMGVVHSSRGVLEPCFHQLKSEIGIICGLANETLGEKSKVKWTELVKNYDKIRDLIEKVIPEFSKFNERVRQPEGFYLPNGARQQIFITPTGKASFTINSPATWFFKKGEYMMMTIRSHDQFNTTIYGLDDRYRGIFNERRIILMNKKDMLTEGVKVGDVVDLFSDFNGTVREANGFIIVPYDIPEGDVATYFPEANTLIPIDSVADMSNTPTSKSVVITMKKRGA